ncbi:MAG TPA: NAD-dependent epimerase/dehydratase family protein, partial [Spirochaetia bacterium]|nr:NAD-dependent epimerase/dehydratase family protein [Spirochaetia bacterium]
MKSILLTGALGQLGSEFVTVLRSRFGADKVVATDIRASANPKIIEEGPFYQLDARDGARLLEIVRRHRVDMIFHLAALL